MSDGAKLGADDCELVASYSLQKLRSADVDTCIKPQTNTLLHIRSFAVASPNF